MMTEQAGKRQRDERTTSLEHSLSATRTTHLCRAGASTPQEYRRHA